jgi:hypothetical protein
MVMTRRMMIVVEYQKSSGKELILKQQHSKQFSRTFERLRDKPF